MKYLKIDKGEGLFLKNKDENDYRPISEMVSTDIYSILFHMGDDDNVEFDEDVKSINNNATQIAYESLLVRLKDFSERKDVIKKEIDDKYKPLEEKYL